MFINAPHFNFWEIKISSKPVTLTMLDIRTSTVAGATDKSKLQELSLSKQKKKSTKTGKFSFQI
jgi:hypothetical protein